jgi:hypothetical protein
VCASRRTILAIAIFLLCACRMGAATTQATPLAVAIQISPNSSFLDLSSANNTILLRQASTPVRVTVMGAAAGTPHRIEVYACVDNEQALSLTGKSSGLAAETLRVRSGEGEWMALEPLPALGGRRGVRVATVNTTSAEFLLQVQLQVPASQPAGTYQGSLVLLAQER